MLASVADRYDVVVVGARCAGAPLATLLARAGVRVALVEQAVFPRDTLSTHIFEADAGAFLHRLGVSEQLRATGAPFIRRADARVASARVLADWPLRPGDVAGITSVRRLVLDEILARTAEEAGADVHMGTRAIAMLEDGGRVAGMRVSADSSEAELRARLVVGADGRNSTVARLCAARRYNVTQSQRIAYYTYFEAAEIGEEPTFVFHRWADRLVLGCPADSGLYLVVLMPDVAELGRFRANLESSFMDHALSCEPVAAAIAGARRSDKIFGIVRWSGYFRDPSGSGWALVGDAGHFKDPVAGRGIGDAFHQVDALAPAIIQGLAGSDADLDRAMERWGSWRDREFAEFYWFATDLGNAGPPPVVVPEVVRDLQRRGNAEMLFAVMSHRARPSRVVTPPRLAKALSRVLLRGPERRRALREVGSAAANEVRRRRLNRHPVYEDGARSGTAGQVESGAQEALAGR
jgi:flavin-dependent dehydrogenase